MTFLCDAITAAMDWLALPLSGSASHHIEPGVAWHARAMVLAWAVLLPLGALAARYFKVLPRQDWPLALDNKAWWHAHRVLQYGGMVLMSVGLVLVWSSAQGSSAAARVHAWIGWSICAGAWFQVAAGIARGTKGGPTDAAMRGDHFDMTPRRVVFERLHKSIGWMAVLLAIPTIGLGLHVADAPRWMPVVLAVWWMALGAVAAALQRQGRCIDTYQAIWGPDAALPGNSRPVIGWGVRRYDAAAWRARIRSR